MLLMLSCLVIAASAAAQTPAPAPAQPTPATPRPAQPRPAQPRRAAPAPAARSGMAMVVTDMSGMPLGDVNVQMSGAATRTGQTDMNGQLNFPGLQPGTYRLRFTGNSVTAFEREVTLRAGAIERLEIKLSAAAAPARPAAPPPSSPPPAPTVGPAGSPQIGSVSNLADREKNTKEPRREVLLSCSGNTRTVLLVLNQEQTERVYDAAEATYYVVAGQGAARVGTLQSVIGAGSLVAVPRRTPFTLSRQGNRPLILLWTLSGEPCEQAR